MRLAILGATGMIGQHAARAAAARGHELIVLHRAGSDLAALADLQPRTAVADLGDAAALTKAFEATRPDAVLNCAGYYPTAPKPWRAEVSHAVEQMGAFYDACADASVPRVVYLGGAIALPRRTDGAPGDETLNYPGRPADETPYVQVKWALDDLARARASGGLPVVTGIPTMCFGEYDKGPTTGKLVMDLANRTLPAYIRGNRNVIYAGDAGLGMVLCCEKGRAGERYLLTGTNLTMDELVLRIAKVAKVGAPKRVLPLGVARLVSKAQELKFKLLGGELPQLSSTAIAVMSSGQFLSGAKARAELGFESTVSVDEAIARTLAWFRKVGYVK